MRFASITSLEQGKQKSLHKYLLNLMEWEDQSIQKFLTPEDNTVYRPRVLYFHKGKLVERSDVGCYSVFYRDTGGTVTALDEIHFRWKEDEAIMIFVDKEYINASYYGSQTAEINYNGDILNLEVSGEEPDSLNNIPINIPVPPDTVMSESPYLSEFLLSEPLQLSETAISLDGLSDSQMSAVIKLVDYFKNGE